QGGELQMRIKPMRSVFLLAAAAWLAIPGTFRAQDEAPPEYREFRNESGKVIQAVLVDKTADSATLLLRNGQRAEVPISSLSEPDRDYVKEWNKEKAIFLQKCR